MGHLDVLTKLVELGAAWPHGKGVDEEEDVVTLLVENYKGPRRMQVCCVSCGSCFAQHPTPQQHHAYAAACRHPAVPGSLVD
jgi:hypothetical protein